MLKVIAASMVFVLVVGSAASADVLGQIQDQVTQIGLSNNIDLLHGSQEASSLQNLVVNNEQCATGICSAVAHEGFFASLGQVGNSCGNCALVGVAQDLVIGGTQAQQVGEGIGPKAQVQGVVLQAGQTLAKADGEGHADALHTMVLQADQSASNPAGDLHESSTTMGMQTSSISGAPGATGLVDAGMVVTTSQTQGSL
jgi:hypothetical protein